METKKKKIKDINTHSFMTPDGVVFTVNWVADGNWQKISDHFRPPTQTTSNKKNTTMPKHVKMCADLKTAGVLSIPQTTAHRADSNSIHHNDAVSFTII